MKKILLNYFIPTIILYLSGIMWLLKDFDSLNYNFFSIKIIFPVLIVVILFNQLHVHETIISFTARTSSSAKVYNITLYFVIIALCLQFISAIRSDYIHFDTWQIYDMSQNVFTDFGKMDMIGQHIVNTNYEMAFPPVFPTLISWGSIPRSSAAVNKI